MGKNYGPTSASENAGTRIFSSYSGFWTGPSLLWPIHRSRLNCLVCPTFPPPGWYLMLSMDPILERTFFRSGVGALIGRGVRGARGTAGFFSRVVCLGTGGLVITRRRWEAASPLVAAAGAPGEVVEAGRGRATETWAGNKTLYRGILKLNVHVVPRYFI